MDMANTVVEYSVKFSCFKIYKMINLDRMSKTVYDCSFHFQHILSVYQIVAVMRLGKAVTYPHECVRIWLLSPPMQGGIVCLCISEPGLPAAGWGGGGV